MTIAWFHEIDLGDISLVGGKGANLGKMARAGLPVPPGFCVTTDAYKQFIREMNLWTEMEHLLATLPAREAGERIRQRMENARMPESISKSIKEAYAKLNGGLAPVAVRSSATAEDLADASFAGQQESYLGIRGNENLTLHVQRCWASLWTERAIAYRERNHFPHQQVSLSVVVQEMVASDVAGVLFTVNPVTNQKDEMLINAAYGLGESVVSGRVTPDTFRVARKRFRVIEQTRGTKATRIDMTDGGTVESSTVPTERERLSLDDSALRRLLALGEKVEKYYGAPQDIEWAIAENQLYLLQTRPVTSLTVNTPTPQILNRAQHAIVNDILEHYPEPPYPLDYSAVTDSYQQLTNAFRDYGVELPPSDEIILLDKDGIPNIVPPNPRLKFRFFFSSVYLLKKLNSDPNIWLNKQHAEFTSELNALRKVDVTKLSNLELVQFIQSAVDVTSRVGAIRFRDFIIPAIARSAFLKLLMSFVKDSKQINVMDLLGDLPYKTAVIDHALHQLAIEAGKLPHAREILLNTSLDSVLPAIQKNAEGQILLEKVQAFLDEHGARTMRMYLPFSNRSWSETPATLLTTIAVILRSDKPHAESNHYDEIRQRLLSGLSGWFRSRFISTLEKFRIGHIARESTLYTIEEGFLQARRGVDEATQRLVNGGALPKLEQIIYLTLTELYAALNGSLSSNEITPLILRREKARPQAMKSWRGQWQTVKKSTSNTSALKGLSGSSGYAEGTVKVVNGPAEFDKLQSGDVLVCPYTDPAWTPLFTLASAVVSDTGGPLSHAAIVAREYGIPAVLGTQTATSQLKDGDQVSVNGRSGEVKLMKSI